MNKYVFLFLLCLLSGCVMVADILTKELSGREVYVCYNDYGITIGKKTIQKITEYDGRFRIHLINTSGNEEVAYWHYDTDYEIEIQRDLVKYPFCTKSEYEKYEKTLKEKELAILREKEKRKRESDDCKQALEKAEHRKKDINSLEGNLLVLDESITSNAENRTSNWSFCFKVIGYDSEGIIVESRCTFSPVANVLLGAFVGCEEKNYFIYTSDDYADGECYKDWRYLHKDAGVHNWKGKRIRAFRKTNYKISEIEYQTYLQNKEVKCCISNNQITACE